jgi:hypothetical protein
VVVQADDVAKQRSMKLKCRSKKMKQPYKKNRFV